MSGNNVDWQDRHSRQSRYWRIGESGQDRIRAGRVLVVGCGALGSAIIDLLARAGVGRMTIVDRDFVEPSNLQRQILFEEADAATSTPKAIAAARAVARIDSGVKVHALVADVTPANVERLVADVDVIVDGTDNLETRYLLNDVAVKANIPWIYGGAIGSSGSSMTILPGETACFRCVYPTNPTSGPVRAAETCETAGVLVGAVVSVAAIEWAEVIKILTGNRQSLRRGLTMLDVWTNEALEIDARPRDPECPACGLRRFDFLSASATSRSVSLCGNAVQISPAAELRIDPVDLGRRLETVQVINANEYLVRFVADGHEMTVFADGRAIVKGTMDTARARSLYAAYVGS